MIEINNNTECIICLNNIEYEDAYLILSCCKNYVHINCLNNWYKNKNYYICFICSNKNNNINSVIENITISNENNNTNNYTNNTNNYTNNTNNTNNYNDNDNNNDIIIQDNNSVCTHFFCFLFLIFFCVSITFLVFTLIIIFV